MIVAVGSENKAKLKAVERAFLKYFKGVEVRGSSAESAVGKQPKSLEEIAKGAKNRAKAAFEAGAEFGVGIEAGIFQFPWAASGYMDTACCAIYDGKEFYLGCSAPYEYPKKVVEKILKEEKDVGEAFIELYRMKKEFAAGEESVSSFLSRGVVPRAQLLEQAVVMALLRIINKEVYND